MMYSIMTTEELFPPSEFPGNIKPIKLKGALVEVRFTSGGARIERVLSGKLNDYLDPDLAVGKGIKKGLF